MDTPADQPARRPRRWRRALAVVVIAGAVMVVQGSVALAVVNQVVLRSSQDGVHAEVAEVPNRAVAIVFGAGLFDGQPSVALANRLDGAVALYQQGRVQHLLMSGDNSRPDYDEVSAMRQYAIDRGVPAEAITRDYAGFDTYDSCYRARDVFGVDAAVLVTQDVHLPRALYTCEQLGLDVVGLAVPGWDYRGAEEATYTFREWLARGKAFMETNLTHPEPQYLGPEEGLTPT